ncbi:adhesion G-protein coupled receptor G2-like [Watersipora subatra]|uniref:adhesion G-protein coupled receptor G2-like n=1 Tax=Watersipora subatra TaxID=2589382 RepID=UPI00355B7976
MFVEAIIQYLRFVKVFNTYIPKFMLKTSLPAFAAPLIIVAITIAVDIDLYKGSDLYCWMKPEAIYYAMMLPIGLVLFFNLIIFIRVLCALVVAKRNSNKIRSNQSSREKEILYLLAAIGVFAVLGLSWIFGYLTIVTSASIAFRYLFSIFSTIQGLLIFLCHNIREPNIRKEWTTALTCKWGKKAGEKRVNLAKSPTETESSNETRLSNLSNYKT